MNMNGEPTGPEVGEQAPEFFIETPHGRLPLSQLAARYEKIILMSQDSYQYHPN
jgi:hypothetical protein